MKCDFKVKYDIAVIGGGIAGIAAALQAARCGRKVALIEKSILPGGLATSGLVFIYLPLCDGNGRQVTFGIPEELLHASIQYGPGDIPSNWRNERNAPEPRRYRTIFSPAAFILSLDELLEKTAADLWYDTLLCDVVMNAAGDTLCGAVVENTSGRGIISADCFIDASGDCSLARKAGIDCLTEDNYLSIWALQYNRERPSGFGERISMFTYIDAKSEYEPYRGMSGRALSGFVRDSRRILREYYRKNQTDRNALYPLKVPAMPQFRKIFCIRGEHVLDDGENDRHVPDSVGLLPDWRTAGPVWEVPFRSLYPEQRIRGLLAAGRCVSARNDAWEITRVIPAAAMTGQAAGQAAAMMVRERTDAWELNVRRLQESLRANGVRIHRGECTSPRG